MSRAKADYYPTPPDAIIGLRRVIEKHELLPGWELRNGSWFEPACGRGSILRWFGVDAEWWLAYELQEGLAEDAKPHGMVLCCDALDSDWPIGRNVIMNPPFSLLTAFIRRGIEVARVGRHVLALTRSQWMDEPAQAWLRTPELRPSFEVKLCWRISFTGDGSTDFATYSWWIWNGANPKPSTVKFWVERPEISGKVWDEYRSSVVLGLGPAQRELEV